MFECDTLKQCLQSKLSKLKQTSKLLIPEITKRLWYIFILPLLPYFLYHKEFQKWRHPIDPNMMLVSIIFNFILPTVDMTLDVANGIRFIQECHFYYGGITLAATMFPLLGKFLIELKQTIKVILHRTRLFKKTWSLFLVDRLKNVAISIPFVQPFAGAPYFLEMTNYKAGDIETELAAYQLGQDKNLEAFLEATPQFCLQLFILMKHREANVVTILSMISSFISLSLAASSSFLVERIEYGMLNPSFLTKLFLAFFFILIIIPRCICIAMIGYIFEPYLGIFVLGTFIMVLLSVKLFTRSYPLSEWKWNPDIGNGDRFTSDGEYEPVMEMGYGTIISNFRLWRDSQTLLFLPFHK